MAIILTDGFDSYADNNAVTKFWTLGTYLPNIVTGRYDGKAVTPRLGSGGAMSRKLPNAYQTVSAGFAAFIPPYNGYYSDFDIFGFEGTYAGTNFLRLMVNSSLNRIGVRDRNGTRMLTDSMPVFNSGWHYFELTVSSPSAYAATDGSMTVYMDGIMVANFTGLRTDFTDIDEISIISQDSNQHFDDLYVTDGERLGEVHIATLRPNSNIQSEFTPSVGTSNSTVMANNLGSTSHVKAQTAGLQDWYGLQDINNVTTINGNVVAVSTKMAGYKDSFGPAALTQTVRSNTTVIQGPVHQLLEEQANEQVFNDLILMNDPHTSSSWTRTAIDNLELGLKS